MAFVPYLSLIRRADDEELTTDHLRICMECGGEFIMQPEPIACPSCGESFADELDADKKEPVPA